MQVSKDILEKMDSASHFEKEVPLTMTQLAELMETCGDTVFTVVFHKKLTQDSISAKLSFSDMKNLNKLALELSEGEQC